MGVNVSPLEVFGQAGGRITAVGKEFRAKVLVVSPPTTLAILGLDYFCSKMLLLLV